MGTCNSNIVDTMDLELDPQEHVVKGIRVEICPGVIRDGLESSVKISTCRSLTPVAVLFLFLFERRSACSTRIYPVDLGLPRDYNVVSYSVY